MSREELDKMVTAAWNATLSTSDPWLRKLWYGVYYQLAMIREDTQPR